MKLKFGVKDPKGVFSRMWKAAVDYARNQAIKNFEDVKPFVAEVIDDIIGQNQWRFQPSQKYIHQLGVGADGRVDWTRIDNAWKDLLLSEGTSSKLSVKREPKGKQNQRGYIIGNITFTMYEEGLYRSKLAKIQTPDSDKIKEIPWLRWYIEGHTIDNYVYIRKKSTWSRTGTGLMVVPTKKLREQSDAQTEGGTTSWTIETRAIDPFRYISKQIREELRQKLSINGATIFK